MKDVVHTCEIRYGCGARLRLVAIRFNRRPLLADFDVLAIAQEKGASPRAVGGGTIHDFPRGLGVEGLFASILSDSMGDKLARDENGVEVPLPEKTPAEWKRMGMSHVALARECFAKAGVGGPELIDPDTGDDLFGGRIVVARQMPAAAKGGAR